MDSKSTSLRIPTGWSPIQLDVQPESGGKLSCLRIREKWPEIMHWPEETLDLRRGRHKSLRATSKMLRYMYG